ncbi:NACHT domain-containing protein [Mycena venus]|uniref:NACHT domain-containing protein n=1 Tax=Mycena venus TaxID=2733690 RepID=A0A8H6Z309_9AGAR|nr:NACHT domain-containing protein [Mycena venus]
MNQVSYRNETYVPAHHLGVAPSRRGIDGVLAQQQSIRSIRPERRPFREQNLPYDRTNRGHRRGIQNPPGGLSHAIVTSEATAIFHNTVPTHSGDYGNISIDNQMRGNYPETTHHQDAGRPPVDSTSGNTFTSVAGNVTQLHVTSYGESGLDILYRFIAMGAVHDSAERFAEPACHPGTRVAVLERLTTWADDTRRESSILWLHGPAGMGKSAIAQLFAGNCNNRGRLGASFFFKRGDPERGSWHRLFTTIAFQLAHSVPGLLLHIQHAVEANKLVVNQAKELQFQRLVVETLQQAPMPEVLPILVLDGLDECEDPQIQQDILRLFISVIHVHNLPLRILIASRPEPHIRGSIETKVSSDICQLMELHADKTAYEDVRTYLKDGFCTIYSQYSAEGIDLGDAWPFPEAVEHLVKKSSGIFIYAVTVIRFVGDLYSGSHPQERLDSVLNLNPESTAPLDDLYTQILSVVKQTDRQLRIMHAIWHRESQLAFYADPEEIDFLLVLPRGTSRLALRGLHSLLEVPPVATRFSLRFPVNLLHTSFADYLGDPRRSKGWCLVLPWLHSDFLHCMVRLLSSPPSTDSARLFYKEIVDVLPVILRNATPCDQWFNLLRNTVFQSSLFFHEGLRFLWPQRGSEYPIDLIQLWECHQFVCTLTENLKFSKQDCFPTFRYDSLYTEILSEQSTLTFVLSVQAMHPDELEVILRMFDLSYRTFEPFFPFREHLDLPFSEGDSPLDFIADPERAGELYLDPRVIAEVLVLQWIVRTREFVIAGDFFPYRNLLRFIEYCGPSLKILDALVTLDISKICDQISDDQVHKSFHHRTLSADDLLLIVNWLKTFPEPPQEAIDFWETQVAAIWQCKHNYWG